MSELEEAIKLFGREDLLGGYGIQDTDTNIEVFMSIKDMVKYYRQDKEIERQKEIIRELDIKNLELTTIIKEVREYINKIPTQPVIRVFKKELLEILDKVGSDKE